MKIRKKHKQEERLVVAAQCERCEETCKQEGNKIKVLHCPSFRAKKT